MTPNIGTQNFQYNSIMIERYIYSRPFWKRFLARFFEKHRITKDEYDKWFTKQIDYYN